MTNVVAFPAAPRTDRQDDANPGPDGGESTARVILFTGVWYERTDGNEDRSDPPKARRRKRRG